MMEFVENKYENDKVSVRRKVTISKNLEKTEGKPQKNSRTEKIAGKDRKKVSRRDCDGIVMKIRKKFGEDGNICDIRCDVPDTISIYLRDEKKLSANS